MVRHLAQYDYSSPEQFSPQVVATQVAQPKEAPISVVPVAIIPSPTPVTAPIAPKKLNAPKPLTPLQMTRDALDTAESTTSLSAKGLGDAGKLDVTSQIVRMLAALLLVLSLILGAVKLLRKFNLVPEANQATSMDRSLIKASTPFGTSPIANVLIAGMKKNEKTIAATDQGKTTQILVDAPQTIAGFKLLSSLSLPGTQATIHLVQASEKTLVLATSASGGVSVLTEVTSEGVERQAESSSDLDGDFEENDDDAVNAFAEILREKAGLPSLSGRPDILALDQVDARLSATQERLNARLKTGAELTSLSTPTSPRRRTAKNAQTKAVGV